MVVAATASGWRRALARPPLDRRGCRVRNPLGPCPAPRCSIATRHRWEDRRIAFKDHGCGRADAFGDGIVPLAGFPVRALVHPALVTGALVADSHEPYRLAIHGIGSAGLGVAASWAINTCPISLEQKEGGRLRAAEHAGLVTLLYPRRRQSDVIRDLIRARHYADLAKQGHRLEPRCTVGNVEGSESGFDVFYAGNEIGVDRGTGLATSLERP